MKSQDRAWKDYSERFRREVFPQLASSAVVLSIFGDHGEDIDVRQATELGAMLLLGKPLLLITTPGATLPPGLRRAADVVVENVDMADPSSQDRIAAALRRLAGGAGR